MSDGGRVICPYCDAPYPDVGYGGDPGPWWDGQDGHFEVLCKECGLEILINTVWSPRFECYKREES
jgi:hypothetical protein